jgi:hemerythrin-like domain-containing protein
MANIKINGKTSKTKKAAPRNSLLLDEKYIGEEPKWDTERAKAMSFEEFDHFMRKSLTYYNYFYTQKDLKKHVVAWMKVVKDFDADEIRAFERASDRTVSMTTCGLIMAHRQGMPLQERHIEFIDANILESINSKSAEEVVEVVVEEKPRAHVPTIQDRLNEKTADTIGELEGHYDEFIANPKYQFKPYDYLVANNVPQSQLSKYEAVYQARFDELKLAFERADEQLQEGYSHYKTADFKRIFAFIDQILNDIIQYRGVKKATKKVRAPKSVSKEKVVSKLKYAREDKVMRLISVNPADIIGAQELWVYNTKTRKLGKYIADSLKGPLNVKGTGIIGYDEHRSTSKTLRKPEEKLKEFARATKVELRKFLDNIKATETKLNGRINLETILLRVQ